MSLLDNFKILESVSDFIETTDSDIRKDIIDSIKIDDVGVYVRYGKSVSVVKKLLEPFTKAISIDGKYQLVESSDGDKYYTTTVKNQQDTLEVALAIGTKKNAYICIASVDTILDSM